MNATQLDSAARTRRIQGRIAELFEACVAKSLAQSDEIRKRGKMAVTIFGEHMWSQYH
jgi:hypothetical protein